jgi:hypothetical protein
MEAAASALSDEDALLAKALTEVRARSAAHKQAFEHVGIGISYWLYETTVVYLIWRAWVTAGTAAAWDWTVADLEGFQSGRDDGGLRFDLVVFGNSRKPELAFEAKWWNRDNAAARRALRDDAFKLRDSRILESAKKYLMVFWHEPDHTEAKYRDEVAAFCKEERLRPAGDARFPARFRDGGSDVLGSFVIALLEVTKA